MSTSNGNWLATVNNELGMIRANTRCIETLAHSCKELGLDRLADNLYCYVDGIMTAEDNIGKTIGEMLRCEMAESQKAITDTFQACIDLLVETKMERAGEEQ